MALSAPIRLTVDEATQVAPVRRAAETMAADLGLDPTRRGQSAIVATELATNLVRHGGGGEIVVRGSATGGMEIVAWDRGPGIADLASSIRDGVSGAGGPGNGLGAVRRLANEFDVYTAPAQGSVVLARMGAKTNGAPKVDGLALALRGEQASGDAWGHVVDGPIVTILLADGLGHGPDAARAALTAVGELEPRRTPRSCCSACTARCARRAARRPQSPATTSARARCASPGSGTSPRRSSPTVGRRPWPR